MSYKITDVEGIGPAYAEKLAAADIKTTDGFLKHCADAKGRKAISEATGIGESTLLTWANMADLMRVSGVGGQFAELLQASGVDTIKELRTRNAENLAAKMIEVNEEKKLTKGSINSDMCQKWIDAAKDLEPTITH